MMRARSGLALTVTGFLACPCHLPLTLPLLLTLLGGTSLGLSLRENTGLIFVVATAYFLVAIGVGLVLLNGRTRDSDSSLCCSIDQTSASKKDQTSDGLDNAWSTLTWR